MDQKELYWRNLVLTEIVRSSRDHLLVTDEKGVIRMVGPSCKEIYGRDVDELLGKNVVQLEEEKVFSPSVTRLVMREGKMQTMMQETHSGKKLMVSAYPVWTETGEMCAVISYSHDLTEILELKRRYETLTAQLRQFEHEMEELRERGTHHDGFIAVSEEMKTIDRLINKVAVVDSTVLILGESGVGKNVVAKEIHKRSQRKDGPFIEINCGSIPEGLLESELFGYEAGSFTGAGKEGKRGMIELANDGTLFMDELGELPLSLQAKLLKVLQEKRFQRIGSTTLRQSNFRLVAATNRDLEQMVREGTFRQDLYFRLNVIPIYIPPLRQRPEDIASLIKVGMRTLNERYGQQKEIASDAMRALLSYPWPGNVRELMNVLERLVVTTDEQVISLAHLPESFRQPAETDANEDPEHGVSLKEILEREEAKWLRRAYEKCRTTQEMARYLGISQPSVVRKLQKYGIPNRFKNEFSIQK